MDSLQEIQYKIRDEISMQRFKDEIHDIQLCFLAPYATNVPKENSGLSKRSNFNNI